MAASHCNIDKEGYGQAFIAGSHSSDCLALLEEQLHKIPCGIEGLVRAITLKSQETFTR